MSYKPFLIGGLFLASTLFLSGCDMEETIKTTEENVANTIASIAVPFEWFKEDAQHVEEVSIPDVNGLVLKEEKVEVDSLVAFQTRLAEMSNQLNNADNFRDIVDGKKSIFHLLGSSHMAMKYGESGDDLTEVIREIGKTPHQFINSITLRQVGVKVDGSANRIPYALIDINAVNDTEDFHIQTIQLSLDETGRIATSTKIGKPTDRPHTVTPLTKDSFLYEDTHQEFEHHLKTIIQSLSNSTLYEQIASEDIQSTDTVIQSLTKQIGLDTENTSTVYSLVQQGKGTFSEWGITGYVYDDKDVHANTFYELTVADEEGYHAYTVHYHRGLKEVTKISTGSPFQEVR